MEFAAGGGDSENEALLLFLLTTHCHFAAVFLQNRIRRALFPSLHHLQGKPSGLPVLIICRAILQACLKIAGRMSIMQG